MTAAILDPDMAASYIARRAELGIDAHDECWDGVYIMTPPPNIAHQTAVFDTVRLLEACRLSRRDLVVAGVAVSPLADGWTDNFRVPDVSVVLTGNLLVNHDTHFQGGPDLVVEIRSRGDDSFQKLDFYAAVGVREALVVERDSREPALFRLSRKKLVRVRAMAVDGQPWLFSRVLPLAFTRTEVKGKPRLLVRRTAGTARTWKV